MIEISRLHKSYGNRQVLKNIDLRFEKGGITGIAGPNACGKSTLIKCILGTAVPNRGEIAINGKPIDSKGEFRGDLGYMPQNPNFPENMNSTELLDMFESLRNTRSNLRDELMEYFGLNQIAKQPIGEFSGGTKQKLAAVIAFMFDPPIIVLDEPTASLDPLASSKFKHMVLRKADEGKTIVMVSHFISELEKLAKRIVFLNDGELVYSGALSELYTQTGASDLDSSLHRLFERHPSL